MHFFKLVKGASLSIKGSDDLVYAFRRDGVTSVSNHKDIARFREHPNVVECDERGIPKASADEKTLKHRSLSRVRASLKKISEKQESRKEILERRATEPTISAEDLKARALADKDDEDDAKSDDKKAPVKDEAKTMKVVGKAH